jgi:hypothetical protein
VRARGGWIAALLLIALAFVGGPDALDTAPPASHITVTAEQSAEERGAQVRDDGIDIEHQIADLGVPGHPRLSALPPSAQTAAPVPVRGTAQAAPKVPAATPVEVGGRPRDGACSPEALQIFRC